MRKTKKWLSRTVILDGLNIGPAIVSLLDDNVIDIEKFTCEREGVEYTEKMIVIETKDSQKGIRFES